MLCEALPNSYMSYKHFDCTAIDTQERIRRTFEVLRGISVRSESKFCKAILNPDLLDMVGQLFWLYTVASGTPNWHTQAEDRVSV